MVIVAFLSVALTQKFTNNDINFKNARDSNINITKNNTSFNYMATEMPQSDNITESNILVISIGNDFSFGNIDGSKNIQNTNRLELDELNASMFKNI